MDKNYLNRANPFKSIGDSYNESRNIYYGEVISINDPTDGGRIKVKIDKFDNKIPNEDLDWAYPLIPKFIHLYPKVGEIVRVFIEDIKYPERGRFWCGSVISQPHKFKFDSLYTALSTTDRALSQPDKAPSTFPTAKGVFPDKEDVGLIGRDNTDIILKTEQLEIRTGKHEHGDPLKLNIKNPAYFSQNFELIENEHISSTLLLSDKIMILSHDGNPKFKSHNIDKEERIRIMDSGHPMVRGDLLAKALNLIRSAIIKHIHGYSTLPADKNDVITDLEKVDFESLLQKNILIN